MPQVRSGPDGAGGEYIKWMCGAGGRAGGAMANLQRGVGSLVRDIGDPCLNPSPVKVAYSLCFFIYPLLLFNMDCMMGIDADANVNANDVLLSLPCL